MKNIVLSLISIVSLSFSQYSEDAVRFSAPGTGIGSRALGMGNAYIGISDDFSAAKWNPAGLGQMRRIEVVLGMTNVSDENTSRYFSNSSAESYSNTSLNSLNFVVPYPTVQGSLVFAFGYNHDKNFDRRSSFNGFNPVSSIIPSLFDGDVDYEIPYDTYLSGRVRDASGKYLFSYTPVTDSVQQSGTVRESGNISNWNFSAAMEIDKDVFFGVTLSAFSGKYHFDRDFLEQDSKGIYANRPLVDTLKFYQTSAESARVTVFNRFNEFVYRSVLNSDINGSQLTIGMLYRVSDEVRTGMTIRFPSTVMIDEVYSNTGTSLVDNIRKYTDEYEATNSYGIVTPWVIGFGMSVYPLSELLLSADVEWTDWTQMEWTENAYLESKNNELQSAFRSTLQYRLGTEFEVPSSDLRLRAGYSVTPSPYKNDPSSYDLTMITGGIGYFLQRNVMLDAAAAYGSYTSFKNQYSIPGIPDPSRTDETVTSMLVNFTVSYRF